MGEKKTMISALHCVALHCNPGGDSHSRRRNYESVVQSITAHLMAPVTQMITIDLISGGQLLTTDRVDQSWMPTPGLEASTFRADPVYFQRYERDELVQWSTVHRCCMPRKG